MEIVYSNCKPTFYHEYALKSEGYNMFKLYTIEVMMQKASLEQYLDFYISNQDVKNGKPDPEMYIKAIERMGLNPDDSRR